MPQPTDRSCTTQSVTITTSASTTGGVDHSHFASGEVHVPNGSTITTLTFHVSNTIGGTYNAAYDPTAAVALTVAANRSYPLPATIFGAAAFKMVGDAAGTVTVNLKS